MIALLVFLLGVADPVTITARPAFSMAPGHVTLVIRIDPSAANRGLDVAIDSGFYTRVSHVDLHGTDSPAITTLSYDRLPAGHYTAIAALDRNDRSRPPAATATFCVSGMEISCTDSR